MVSNDAPAVSDLFGTWQDQKATLDAADDGCGPYLHWILGDADCCKSLWPDFVLWATDHLACGISLACVDGALIVPAAHAAFVAYVAGRNHGAMV